MTSEQLPSRCLERDGRINRSFSDCRVSNDRSTRVSTGQVEDLRMSLRKSVRDKRKINERYPVGEDKEVVQEATNHKTHVDVSKNDEVPELKITKGEDSTPIFSLETGSE